MRSLDARLLAGAAAVRYALAEDFHDRAVTPSAVSREEDDRNIRKLSDLARRSGFIFLFTVIRKDGRFHLTASSATESELAAHKEVRYFDAYDEAAHLRTGVFDATNAVFVSYSDRWGQFRGAYLPEISRGGRAYLSVAEVETSFIRTMLRKKLAQSGAIALLLLLSSIPVFLVYMRRQRRQNLALKEANKLLKREMEERKAVEKELIRARNMEALGTLAGGVAHDFNNILVAVLGHAELALEGVGADSPAAADIEEIRRAGDRAKQLTAQILTFARKARSEVRDVQVAAVAREVIGLIRSFLPSNIRLLESISSTECVVADAVSLHQILMNLCTNAVQAMTETGGQLSVDVRDVTLDALDSARLLSPGRYVRITVADTGPGIPREVMDSIFDPYFTTKEIGSGTGLGLAVVHGIVARLRGDIQVHSTPGSGAAFTVHLLASGASPTTEPEPARIDALPGGSESVLLVDDEVSVALTASRLLERLGYRVTMRTDSVNALALFREKPDVFDLLVTDMTMPLMTGDRLMESIRALRPDLPVILCSGFSEKLEHISPEHDRMKILRKPFSWGELAAAVRGVLDASGT